MRIYISGSITGTERYRERFMEAEARLNKKGYRVINPAELSAVMPQDTNYEEYMTVCMAALSTAQAIYMLEGWENSRGANRELGYALGKKMTVYYQSDEADGGLE